MSDPENWIRSIVVAMIVAILASGVGLSVLLTAARNWFTRPRPAGLCRTCGYSLRGNVSGVCPECGTPAEKEV